MKNRNELFVVIATASFLAFTLFTVLNMGTGCGKGKTSGSSPDSGSGKEMTSSSGGGALSPRERANQADCTSRLKQIGLASFQYAMCYDDFCPTTTKQGPTWMNADSGRSLDLLRKELLLSDPKSYLCPSKEGISAAQVNQSVYGHVSYNWCDGLSGAIDNYSTVVACDGTDNHPDNTGRYLRFDGSVGMAKGVGDSPWTKDGSFLNNCYNKSYTDFSF